MASPPLTRLAALLACTFAVAGYAQQPSPFLPAVLLPKLPDAPGFAPPQSSQQSPLTGTVLTGTVRDPRGAPLPNATITLTPAGGPALTTMTNPQGRFTFLAAPPGPATLTFGAPGFHPEIQSLDLRPGHIIPPFDIKLSLATASTQIEVTATRQDIGRAEVAAEEHQRVLGLFPNYFVTYAGNPVPLTTRQKFALTSKLEFDPVTLALNAVFAGIEQADNAFPGYGQGAAGYGKRLGATFTDSVDASFLGGAILPTLFRQDPRYFFRGPGHSNTNRALYAIASVVRARGDNGKWQPNYSNVLGNLAAAGISNLYYPASDRHGPTLTIDNALLGTAEGAIGALIEEFLIRRITPNLPPYHPTP